MKRKTLIIISALIIVILIAAKLILNKSILEEKKQFKGSNDSRVNIEHVSKMVLSNSLSLTGVTEGIQEVLLKAETNGQIVEINFNIGDYVQKGKVLVEIDDKLAQLSLESAKLNMTRAEDEYNKTKNLYSGQATTENKVRDTKIDFERAKINYEQALKQLSFTKIVATQNGFITSKQIEKGAYVNVGTPILSLVDISQLKVVLKTAEKDVYKLRVGQKVKVTASIYPGVEYNGNVSFVSQQGDMFHNYPVEIHLGNISSHPLKAGTFVNAEFIFPSAKPALLIPREALVGSIKNAKVFVVENTIAKEKNIVVGQDYGNKLEVISGLMENEIIVTSGQINLYDGSTVKILYK